MINNDGALTRELLYGDGRLWSCNNKIIARLFSMVMDLSKLIKAQNGLFHI